MTNSQRLRIIRYFYVNFKLFLNHNCITVKFNSLNIKNNTQTKTKVNNIPTPSRYKVIRE